MVALILFVLGLVVGSFLNVMISRTIEGEDWVRGRSRCDACKKEIKWYDNIPVLSYLLLGGKCRYCKTPISKQHMVIELLTGILFVWWYGVGFAFFRLSEQPNTIIQPLFWLLVGILMLIIFVADWLYQIIPDYASIGLGILALGYRVYLAVSGVMQWNDFWSTMGIGLGLLGFFFGLWYITRGRGMGFGDVKFSLVMGWLLGWQRALVAVFLAFVLGAVVGLVLMGLKLKKMKSKIAFGPFLVLGTGIALVWGNDLWGWYLGLI